jgi:hypothetical protein
MILANLLPLDIAKITSEGINYNGQFYTTPIAIKEQWFLPSNIDENKTVCVCVVPDKQDFILVLLEKVGLVWASKKMVSEPIDSEIIEAYYEAFNELKKRWKNKKQKFKKKGRL